jgi:predicted nuclease with TOPRIM domain
LVQEAIHEITEIRSKLDEIAADLEKVLETLDQIERQNVATEEELGSLRSMVRSMHHRI